MLADQFARDSTQNEILGGKVREEDSPGNYMIYEHADGITVRVFDRWGFGHDSFIPNEPVAPDRLPTLPPRR